MEIGGHDLVDLGEVHQVGQEHGQLDGIGERAAGGQRDRGDVVEHAANLGLDVAGDQLAGDWIERDLAGNIDRVAGAYRLRIGADRLGGRRGVDGESLHGIGNA